MSDSDNSEDDDQEFAQSQNYPKTQKFLITPHSQQSSNLQQTQSPNITQSKHTRVNTPKYSSPVSIHKDLLMTKIQHLLQNSTKEKLNFNEALQLIWSLYDGVCKDVD